MRPIREVCKRCLNNEVPRTDWEDGPWYDFLWNETNDAVWERGKVCCPARGWCDIPHEEFEERCVCLAEHAVCQ